MCDDSLHVSCLLNTMRIQFPQLFLSLHLSRFRIPIGVSVSEHRISLLTASLLEMSNRDIKLVRKYMHLNLIVCALHLHVVFVN